MVRLMCPANVARSAPPVGAKSIESAVIADPIRAVCLDVVASNVSEGRPGTAGRRISGAPDGDRITPLLLGQANGRFEPRHQFGGVLR